ncbi:hypothetical protein [Tortoise microvirus 75]|nr:hypothetical protein [Tortoise microvirus 75]
MAASKQRDSSQMMLDKKALATFKNKNMLHVLLIMDQEKVSKSTAIVQAYHEGVEGLGARQLPKTPAPK